MNLINSYLPFSPAIPIGRTGYRLKLILLAATICLTAAEVSAFSFQPPADRTGAPPSGNTCAACHTSSGNGTLDLRFGDGPLTYVPGASYPIQVLLEDAGQERFGFSMTARDTSSPNDDVGTWMAGNNSGVYDGGRHIGHMNAPFASGSFTFSMMWTAPSEDVGPITFYAAGNAANGNFSNGSGDNIYTRQLTIDPAVPEVPFWDQSPLVDGWRDTGSGYPDLVGIGWIYDAEWPWIYTFSQSLNGSGEWIYIFTDSGDENSFYAYNHGQDVYFWATATFGWYYAFETGNEGWAPFDF